jgi:hypothetical protein
MHLKFKGKIHGIRRSLCCFVRYNLSKQVRYGFTRSKSYIEDGERSCLAKLSINHLNVADILPLPL